MDRIFKLNFKIVLLIFVFLDLLCVGMGMGVPIFCILLGFPIGWYITRRLIITAESVKEIFEKGFIYATITSIFTFLVMIIIWGPTMAMLFDPYADFENFGIPLILYDPKNSFIGWLVLMIFISPFLQLMTTIFASYLTLLIWFRYRWSSTKMPFPKGRRGAALRKPAER
jgi:hypothetical protein